MTIIIINLVLFLNNFNIFNDATSNNRNKYRFLVEDS